MKSGVSIMNPTTEDLAKYELSHEIGPGETALWLGTPNMRHAFFLASPATFLFVIIGTAFWIIKLCTEYSNSAQDVRAMFVFVCIFLAALIIDALVILALKRVYYLLSDRNLYIYIQNNWYSNLSYYTRQACSNHHGQVLTYKLSKIIDLEVRKSFLNRSVGNIYLDNSILPDGIIYQYDPERYKQNVSVRTKRFPIQLSTNLTLSNVLYCINDVPDVCELLRVTINRIVRRNE